MFDIANMLITVARQKTAEDRDEQEDDPAPLPGDRRVLQAHEAAARGHAVFHEQALRKLQIQL